MNEIEFTAYWNELYNCKSKVVLEQGGSSSGKSYTTMQLLLFKLCTEKNIVITCACSTYPQIWRGIYRDATNIINTIPFFKAMIPDINKNGCTCPATGSILEFSAYPTRESAKAGKRDYLFADELSNWNEEIFFELELRTKKQSFCAWNPNTKFWVHRLYEGRDENEAKWFYTTYKANPYCDKKIIESLENLKYTDENKYKVYCLGICGATEGTIFTDWSIISDEDMPTEYKWRAIGLDFGWNDPTAILDVRFSNGSYYVKELKYEGMDNLEIAEFLKSLNLKDDRVICDSAEPRAINELKKLGVWQVQPAAKGQGSIKLGIDAINRYHTFVTKSSQNLQTELLKYSYKQDALGHYTSEPGEKFNHLCDAYRYAVLANEVIASKSKLRSHLAKV